jgi:hypothetical protein
MKVIERVRGLDRADRIALTVLVVFPSILFLIPTLAGHPPITQDNLIQNFPLRTMTGQQLADGHWPTWNPLIFGGSPLLGALNAGSFYPLTIPFAFLPDLVAWLLNVVACYWAAGLGLYALMRWFKIGALPSLLGALTYAYLGMMSGQLVHLAVIQGQGWLPWVVLAILMAGERIRGAESDPSPLGAVRSAGWPLLSLAVLTALVFLTGEPRSIADLEVVAIVVVAYSVAVGGRTGVGRRIVLVACLGVAAGWGVLCSAAQLIPGQHFIALSQRAELTYWFFGSGSLPVNRSILVGIPDFFGGVGMLGQPSFFVSYNISELNGYVGIMGLAALGAAAGALVGRRRRSQPQWLWLIAALGIVGLIASLGSFTPLGHILHAVPLLGRTRLQSRNLVVVDLAAGMALAWFAARLLARDRDGASTTRWRAWVTASPLIVVSAVALVAIVAPTASYEAWGVSADQVANGKAMAPWLCVPIVLSLALLFIVRRSSSWTRVRLGRALVALLVVDASIYMVSTATGLVGGAQDPKPSAAYASSVLGTEGRYALIDPNLGHQDQFIALGQPDSNVFTGLSSVQGYGSLIADEYGEVTGAHVQNGLNPCAIRTGRFDQLRLSTIVMSAGSLAPRIWTPLGFDSSGISLPEPERPCEAAPPVSTTPVRTFFLGQQLQLQRLSLTARSTEAAKTAIPIKVAGIKADGSKVRLRTSIRQTSTGWDVELPGRPLLAGLEVTDPSHKVMSASVAVDVTGNTYYLGGIHQEAMDSGDWRLDETKGSLQIFRRLGSLVDPVFIEPVVKGTTGGRVISAAADSVGGETDIVEVGSRSRIVRSESMLEGWQAEAVSVDGKVRLSPVVERHDLVQSVVLPAGKWKLTWRYQAPGLDTGLALSAVGMLGLLSVGTLLVVLGRRRRAGRVRT